MCVFLCRKVTFWFVTHWADARSALFSVLTAMGRTWKDLPALAYSSPFVQRQDLISNKFVTFCFRRIHANYNHIISYHFRLNIWVALLVSRRVLCGWYRIHVSTWCAPEITYEDWNKSVSYQERYWMCWKKRHICTKIWVIFSRILVDPPGGS